jgi:polysaccharide pyruvyl transferase WcaK-like protein
MPVLLAGAFGQRNPGDEALLASFVQELRAWPLVATTSDRVQTESEHGIETVSAQDPRAVARAVGRADGIVFAGGTVFKTLHPRSGRRPLELLRNGLAVAAAASVAGTPLALNGVGAAPLPTRRARALARGIVHRAALLILRDAESARLLADAGAPAPFRVGADASWTRIEAPTAPSARGDAVIVALSHLAGGPGLAARLARVLAPLQRAGLRLRLQPWQVHSDDDGDGADDLALARALAQQLPAPAEIVPPPATLDDARDFFAGARLVVALRFHALVAAAAAGVPAIAYAHEAKLAGLGKRLGQPVVQPAGTPATVGNAVLAAIEDGVLPAPPEAIEHERDRARAGMALLRLLLSGGRSSERAAVSSLDLVPTGWIA